MTDRSALTIAIAAIAPTMFFATTATAQDEPATSEPAAYSSVWEEWTPSWSSADIANAAEALTGAWKTTGPVAEAGGDATGSAEMLMTVHPAPVSGVPDALYVEQYRADNPARPFRQSVMQFYNYNDGLRLRTYEIIRDDSGKGVLAGMGFVPEAFPDLSRSELIATLDLDVSASGNGFKGKTPYPYPTGVGGAVEMTSEITLSGDTLRTADRGYNAAGDVVWGSGDTGAYSWSRSEPWAKVERRPGGLALINLNSPDGESPEDGDRVFVHYTGWTADGGKFDSSRDKGQPWPLTWPVSEMRVIDGWKQGFDGVVDGSVRKFVIPAGLAYGENGVPRAGIGPNATLYFDTEVMAVQSAPEPESDEAGPNSPDE